MLLIQALLATFSSEGSNLLRNRVHLGEMDRFANNRSLVFAVLFVLLTDGVDWLGEIEVCGGYSKLPDGGAAV